MRSKNIPLVDFRILRTRAEYDVVMARLGELMDSDPAPGSPGEEEIELLVLLLEDYERKNTLLPPPDPIEAILFRLDQMGKTRRDLIPILGSESRVSEVLNRKRPLTLAMIRRLHSELDIATDVLISLAPTLRKAS